MSWVVLFEKNGYVSWEVYDSFSDAMDSIENAEASGYKAMLVGSEMIRDICASLD